MSLLLFMHLKLIKNKMNSKKLLLFVIGVIILVNILVLVKADVIKMPTGNEIVPLVRGDNPGILMSPDITYIKYYVADGRSATIQYSQSIASYFFGKKDNQNFIVAMSIYYAPWFDKKYTLIKNTGIDLFTQKTSLPQTSGVYKFEFKCYGCNWAAVNFKLY